MSSKLSLRFTPLWATCLGAILLVVWSISANADVLEIVWSVGAGQSGCFLTISGGISSSTGPISADPHCAVNNTAGTATSSAVVSAYFGTLSTRVDITADSIIPFNISNSVVVRSQASANYVFTGPDASVSTRLNLSVHGVLEEAGPFGARVQANGVDRTYIGGDVVDDFFGSSFLVSTTAPTPILLSLHININAASFDGTFHQATVGGHNGFFVAQFDPNGPVFTLPEGYTVNGPCVVNNSFTCGPSNVPLPAAIWLLAPALCGLGLARRRKV